MPDKIVAISDIEGNFYGFSNFLIAYNVIDANYNWTFSNGHLILNGDFVYRGNNVVPVLWLIYKLEKQHKTHAQSHINFSPSYFFILYTLCS